MEDFGWAGDETLLDAHNFALEMNELRAMEFEEHQRVLAELAEEDYPDFEDDCPLDGDAKSALASCGWGTDEDYGFYGYEGDEW